MIKEIGWGYAIKLNIMICSSGYINGAGYQRTYKLALELANLGHNVTFLTSQDQKLKFPYTINNKGNLKEVAVFDFMPKKIKGLGLSLIAALIKTIYIINKKYDIVHADAGHRIASGLPCWFHQLIYNTIYVSEWWDYYGKGGQSDNKPLIWKYSYGLVDNWAEVYDKKKADAVIVLSEFTKKRAIEIGVKESKIAIIHGGADVDRIKYVSDKGYRKDYHICENVFLVGCVGVSGIDDLMPFFNILPELRKSMNIQCLTTGKKIDHSMKRKYKIKNELIELGWVNYNDYYKILSTVDVFLLLQKPGKLSFAKWPNKIGDYLSAGRVIITNPINDIKGLIDNEAGSIIPCEWEEESLKKAIFKAYDKRIELLKTGKYNRSIAEVNAWIKRAMELEIFYYKTLKY